MAELKTAEDWPVRDASPCPRCGLWCRHARTRPTASIDLPDQPTRGHLFTGGVADVCRRGGRRELPTPQALPRVGEANPPRCGRPASTQRRRRRRPSLWRALAFLSSAHTSPAGVLHGGDQDLSQTLGGTPGVVVETACQGQEISTATRGGENRCAGTLAAGAWMTVTWLVTPELRPGPGPRDMNALAGRPHSTIATSTGRRAWSQAGST